MHSEDLLVDDGCNWEAVEAVCEGLPQLDVVSSFAFIVESVNTIDRSAFVVSTKDEEILWIFDLVCQKQADCLERLLATVHVVAKEEVVRLRWEATILEETEQVVVLAMNITAYLDYVSKHTSGEFSRHTLMGASSSRRIG